MARIMKAAKAAQETKAARQEPPTSQPKKAKRAEENQKAGKSADRKNDQAKAQYLIFGIRNKIVLCFIVPLLFMIIIGVTAYRKAADGMSGKFQESTIQTIDMV